MTFSAFETSIQDGKVVELYQFQIGLSYLHFTSADADFEYDNRVYEAVALQRTAIEQTAEISKSNIRITAPRDFAIADSFRVSPPSEVILLTIRRIHRGDSEASIAWRGRVLNAEWSGSLVTMTCESVFTSLKRTGLRRLYQKNCGHVVYEGSPGEGCGISDASFRVDATLSSAGGTTLISGTFGTFANGYFSGGFVEWEPTPGTVERRSIRDHIGTTITITHGIVGIPANAAVRAYPGCDHSFSTCKNKFGNGDNFGGQTHIPEVNPFGGSSIY